MEKTIASFDPIKTERLTTRQILKWPEDHQMRLREGLGFLIQSGYPNMPEDERDVWISDFFKQPGKGLQRHAIFFRNDSERLVGASVFDVGPILHEDRIFRGVYLISSTLLPAYQGVGIGKDIGVSVFKAFQPDILFSTCTQSPMLHSRVGLCEKGLVTGYDVYPRLDRQGGVHRLIPIPPGTIDFVVHAFRQIYQGVADGKQAEVEKAVQHLTLQMVRKNMYPARYDFNPWRKNNREDELAEALGLTKGDGVLVVFLKRIEGL